MIAAAFHSRNDDWCLPHKLRVLSAVADVICVILDRSPQSEAICRQFPKVQRIHWQNREDVPDRDEHGSVCAQEGAMRQAAWDLAATHDPKWILLGDTDEVPSPEIVEFLGRADGSVDCWYLDLWNLWRDAYHAIGGESIYSPAHPQANRRGAIVRHRRGVEYRYRVKAIQHVRLEPNPVHEGMAVVDDTHRRARGGSPMQVHYKWANWPRWQASPQSTSDKYRAYLAGVRPIEVPRAKLWRWDADELLRSFPADEPIAVVGNGPMRGKGAEIDRHPCVIRFNNFVIAGHETDVGTTTTAWCLNCDRDIRPREWTGELFTCNSDGRQDANTARWLGTHPHLRLPLAVDWIGEAWRMLGIDNPSTGLTLVCRLLTLGKRVHAYGFDGLVGGHYWNPAETKTTHHGDVAALAKLAAMGVRFR